MDAKPFLALEMLFSLIYIEAKRDPEKMVIIWMIKCKSKFNL